MRNIANNAKRLSIEKTTRWLLLLLVLISVSSISLLGQEVGQPAWTTNWIGAVSEKTGHNLNAVTWANGLYVAVGGRGKILTSADGVLWTSRQSGTIYELFGVTVGRLNEKTKFVAVGAAGTILESSDAINWLPAKSNTTNDFFAVGYGDGTFLAVGVGVFVTKNDQAEWKVSSSPNDNFGGWNGGLDAGTAVTYGDGLFVVSTAFANYKGRGFRKIWISTDKAKTWKEAMPRSGEWWYRYGAIAYGKGFGFLVVGHHSNPQEPGYEGYSQHYREWYRPYDLAKFWFDSNNSGIAWNDLNHPQARWAHFSSDGNTWKEISKPDPVNLFGAAFGDDTFICVGNNGSVRLTTDGIVWESFSAGTDRRLRGVTYGGGQFVAVGVDGIIVRSPHGNKWTTSLPAVVGGPDRYELHGVAEGPTTMVAVGNSGAMLSSNDGIHWTNNPSVVQSDLKNIVYASGKYVAVGASGKILTSTNSESWISSASGVTSTIQCVRFLNNQFVAVGDSGCVLTSVDGLQWIKTESGSTSVLRDASYGNGTYVVVGDGGTVLISQDTKKWSIVPQGSGVNLTGVSYGNDTFVLVGEYGVVRTSTDGESWRLRSNSNFSIRSIDYSNGLFLAVGDKNAILVSPDAKSWSTLTNIVSGEVALYSARYGAKNVLIVGQYITIIRAARDGSTGGGSGGGNNNPISIITQPATQLVSVGGDATLIVEASGEGPLTYQWFLNGIAIRGADQAILNLNKIDLAQTGKYTVTVSNSKGSVESVAASIVTEPEIKIGFYPGVTIRGIPGQSYFIEYLQDLQNPSSWKPLDQITLTESVRLWIDVGSIGVGERFYRVTPVF